MELLDFYIIFSNDMLYFFFFQAEDGIRDRNVTGVQTCALPISDDFSQLMPFLVRTWMYASGVMFSIQTIGSLRHHPLISYLLQVNPAAVFIGLRSEERRVGKECRTRRWADCENEKDVNLREEYG